METKGEVILNLYDVTCKINVLGSSLTSRIYACTCAMLNTAQNKTVSELPVVCRDITGVEKFEAVPTYVYRTKETLTYNYCYTMYVCT